MAVKYRSKPISADINLACQEPIAVVEEKEANVTPAPSDPPRSSKSRLVIRVVIPQEPAHQSAAPPRLNRQIVALVLVVFAAIALTWLGFSWFSSDPSDAQAAIEAPSPSADARSQFPDSNAGDAPAAAKETPPATAADIASGEDASSTRTSANGTSDASTSNEQADAPLSPIEQVVPDVPRSALQTIRGTIRVTVQADIGKEGTVRAATSKVPGPSRYFERLSLEAARKWTFTPSASEDQRSMLIRFHYTQEGATVHVETPQ